MPSMLRPILSRSVTPAVTPGRMGIAALVAYALLSAPVRAATIQVTIDKLVFSPTEVNAKVGDTIEWINKDALAHTATATNGDWNVIIAPKQSGRVVLKKSGAADYFCKYHPNMKGRVVATP
jgi:plastocyanin